MSERDPYEVYMNTLVPMVAPHVGTRELFVLHPQVTAFVRAENAWFLVEQLRPAEAARVDAAALRSRITALGARQLAATVAISQCITDSSSRSFGSRSLDSTSAITPACDA